jgi:preprotein translocase subunit SecE
MEFLDNVKAWPTALRNYVSELQLEMKRVTWPNKKQVQATTVVVILTVFAFAAYFAVVDLVLTRSVTKVYQVFTK